MLFARLFIQLRSAVTIALISSACACQSVGTGDAPDLSSTPTLAELAGAEWVLTDLDRDDALPDDIEVTLIFDNNRISGKSACNRYSGGVAEGQTPGALTVNTPIASTRMACPPPAGAIESRYLDALQNVTRYSFRAGQLVLTWRKDDQVGTMIFTPRKISK